MGNLEPIDRRREPRTQLELSVTIWGADTRGERFVQEALLRNISLSGDCCVGSSQIFAPGTSSGSFTAERLLATASSGFATRKVSRRLTPRFTA